MKSLIQVGELIDRDDINIPSEEHVYEAVIRYNNSKQDGNGTPGDPWGPGTEDRETGLETGE